MHIIYVYIFICIPGRLDSHLDRVLQNRDGEHGRRQRSQPQPVVLVYLVGHVLLDDRL